MYIVIPLIQVDITGIKINIAIQKYTLKSIYNSNVDIIECTYT